MIGAKVYLPVCERYSTTVYYPASSRQHAAHIADMLTRQLCCSLRERSTASYRTVFKNRTLRLIVMVMPKISFCGFPEDVNGYVEFIIKIEDSCKNKNIFWTCI